MKFCQVCENMLYISISKVDEDVMKLTYSCKHCGFATFADDLGEGSGDSSVVLSTDYSDDQTVYKQFVSPYIANDPTLPRTSDIACPNGGCPKAADAENEVIFVKYDPVNLKYLYHCMHCRTFWKTGGAVVEKS